jgi:hypothetical protein
MSCSEANPCQPGESTTAEGVVTTTEFYCLADGQCVAAYCDPADVEEACFIFE